MRLEKISQLCKRDRYIREILHLVIVSVNVTKYVHTSNLSPSDVFF